MSASSIFGIKTRSGLQNDVFCLQEERDYFQTRYLEQVSEIHALKEELAKSKKEISRLRLSVMHNEHHNNHNHNHNNTVPPDHITATPKNSNGHNNRVALTASCSDSYDDDNLLDNDSQEHIAKKDDASSLTAEEIEELLTDDDDNAAEAAVYRTPSRSNKKKNRSSHKDDNDNDNDNNDGEEDKEEEVEDVRKSAEKLLQWASYRSRTSNSQRSTSLSRNAADGRDSPSVLTSNSVARQPSLLGKMIDTMDDDDDDDDIHDLSGYHDDDNDDNDDDNYKDDDEEHMVVEQEQKQEEQNDDH